MEPLSKQRMITLFECPECRKESNSKDEIEFCIADHEYKELKRKVSWWGGGATFETEQQALTFLKYRMEDWRKNKDWNDTYDLDFKWEGPGKYIENHKDKYDQYHGTGHTTVIWRKYSDV